eukprot:gnl/TRDRNA2_/TRDRNA2_82149_c0_seq4.p1 gnl/TRDRNA2_/TRDRNA2_82149_c0~~gnl/TRDRNA2_/TRDRNA2_82149_c0_seq4.p1  ORF type:complete len:201 (+),score=45.70 gnl/TRDRNA2_/TRDRNA2_82149_c0_seq4:93-695(+)
MDPSAWVTQLTCIAEASMHMHVAMRLLFSTRKEAANAVTQCERAAHLGHREAMATLGAHLLAGEGIPTDSAKAAGWLQKAAEAGDAKAQCNLAVLLSQGIGISADPVAARRWCEASAQSGDPDGQHNLGQMLLTGVGGRIDRVLAEEWLARAAAQGHARARKALVDIQGSDICVYTPAKSPEEPAGSLPLPRPLVFEIVD